MDKQRRYLLVWIDMLISVKLYPEKSDISLIGEDQARFMLENLEAEKEIIKTSLMSYVLSGSDTSQIENLIGQYRVTSKSQLTQFYLQSHDVSYGYKSRRSLLILGKAPSHPELGEDIQNLFLLFSTGALCKCYLRLFLCHPC